jgi:hypothetical protein
LLRDVWAFSTFAAFSAFLAFLAFLAFVLTDVVGHGPIVSPWRRCAGSALRETVIVTDGFFFECVRWQIVTFFGYCEATGGLPAGETAPPIDASAPPASTAIAPVTAMRPLPPREDLVIASTPRFDVAAIRSRRGCGGYAPELTRSAGFESRLTPVD